MLRDKNLIPLFHHTSIAWRCACAWIAPFRPARSISKHGSRRFSRSWTGDRLSFCRRNCPVAVTYPVADPLVQELLPGQILLRDFFARAAARKLHAAGLPALVEKLPPQFGRGRTRTVRRDAAPHEAGRAFRSGRGPAAIPGGSIPGLHPAHCGQHACAPSNRLPGCRCR